MGRPVLDATWRDVTGEPPALELTGSAALTGAFRVADVAVAAVGTALLAAARWHGARSVTLDVAAAPGLPRRAPPARRRRAVLRTREEWRAHPQSAAVAPAFPDY